jgi:hypothetical protein
MLGSLAIKRENWKCIELQGNVKNIKDKKKRGRVYKLGDML